MTHPKRLLSNVAWRCRREAYEDQAAFAAAVQKYQDDIMGERSEWEPSTVVLQSPTVELQFECWNKEGTEQPEPVFELRADNGEHFTMLELFHKVCDGVGRCLLEQNLYPYDHSFFEGLSLANEVPRYYVSFGS